MKIQLKETPECEHEHAGLDEFYVFPASLAQKRFWALDQIYPQNPAYNVAVRFRLEGRLDAAVLERAFNRIISRHEALRTSFKLVDGIPMQVIAPRMTIQVPIVDLLGQTDPEAQVDRLSLEEARLPFDLSAGPLLRVTLLRLSPAEHILLLTAHHAICDGWSIGLVSSELGAIYEAFARRLDCPLPPLPIQYADFTVWQKQLLDGNAFEKKREFWEKQLRDAPRLDIPTDHPRAGAQTFAADIVSEVLPRALTDALQELAGSQDTTFFSVVFGALCVLLRAHSGQTDFSVGTQVAGRNRMELEQLVGDFINTIVLRADASGSLDFTGLLARVKAVILHSLANQEMPFELLLETLKPTPDASRNPLFQVNLICQRDFVRPMQFAGVTLKAEPSKSQGALYDLNFFFVERADGWRLSCEYNTDLFETSSAERMLREYKSLLESVARDPRQSVSALLEQVSSKRARRPGDLLVFPLSVSQRRFWNFYQVAPGNASLNMPLVMRVSGPLDAAALNRAINEVVSRHEALRTTFSVVDGCPSQVVSSSVEATVCVRDLSGLDSRERELKCEELIREEARRPFRLSQAPLLRAMLARLEREQHVLTLTLPHIICDGWSAGLIAREIGAIYGAFEADRPSPLPEPPLQYADFTVWQNECLNGAVIEEQLAYWKRQLSGQLPLLDLPMDRPYRLGLDSSGEFETLALPPELIESCHSFCKREEVTPFMLFLTAFQVLLSRYSGQDDILIGSPVAGRTPQTEGVVGLFADPVALRGDLSGDPSFRQLLARVREMTLSALAHKDAPFGRVLEQIQADQIRGRNPLFQVFFMYQTAFLQPIETPSVSFTPMRSVSPGTVFDLHLGIIERSQGTSAELEYNPDLFDALTIQRMLQSFSMILREALLRPETPLSEAPVVACGTRKAPALGGGTIQTRPCCVRARDPLESQLVEIWQDLLGVKPIGVTDNFFDLNGNSLLASQLFTKVKQRFGRSLPLSTLFQAPTIERLAELLRTADSKRAWSSVVAIKPEGSKPPLFLISGLGGNVVRFRDLGRNLGPDQPVYALQPPGLDGEQAPLTRLEDMAAHYIREIRRVQPAGPYHFAGYSFGGLVMFEMAQQLSAQNQHVGLLALLDTPEWNYIRELRRSAPFRHRLQTYQSRVRSLLFGPDRAGYLKRRLQKRAASLLYRMFRALGWPLWQTVGTLEDANSFAGRTYQAKPYDGMVTVLRGQWRTTYDGEDPDLGWGRLARLVDVYNIPGDHDSIMTEPRVKVLAEKLILCLERANAATASEIIGAL